MIPELWPTHTPPIYQLKPVQKGGWNDILVTELCNDTGAGIIIV